MKKKRKDKSASDRLYTTCPVCGGGNSAFCEQVHIEPKGLSWLQVPAETAARIQRRYQQE